MRSVGCSVVLPGPPLPRPALQGAAVRWASFHARFHVPRETRTLCGVRVGPAAPCSGRGSRRFRRQRGLTDVTRRRVIRTSSLWLRERGPQRGRQPLGLACGSREGWSRRGPRLPGPRLVKNWSRPARRCGPQAAQEGPLRELAEGNESDGERASRELRSEGVG